MSHDSAAVAIAVVILSTKSIEEDKNVLGQNFASGALLQLPRRPSDHTGTSPQCLSTEQSRKKGVAVGVAVLPIERYGPGMFLTEPSLAALSAWAASSFSTTLITSVPTKTFVDQLQPVSVCLFVPISVTSIALPERHNSTLQSSSTLTSTPVLSTFPHSNIATQSVVMTRKKIKNCCKKYKLVGIFFDVSYTKMYLYLYFSLLLVLLIIHRNLIYLYHLNWKKLYQMFTSN